MTTAIVLSIFGGALVGGWLLWAKFLQFGARWAKIPHVTFRRALVVAIVIQVLVIAVAVLFAWVPTSTQGGALVLAAVEFISEIAITIAILRRTLRATTLQAFKTWLPTLAATAVLFLFALVVIRPYVAEAFSISSNSMAPTLLGEHRIGSCPRCGSTAYGSSSTWDDRPGGATHPMICTKELALCEVLDPPGRIYEGDRVLVSKVLRPRRWDLLVYRLPEDPKVTYVHRLVGLPGEELYINEGDVWIKGKTLQSPESIRDLRYLTASQVVPFMEGWGDKDAPVVLGPDEYFVLGDFSARSRDSRLWRDGAPGHPAYAVPASHIVGVVTHIYWPPRRWRVIRR